MQVLLILVMLGGLLLEFRQSFNLVEAGPSLIDLTDVKEWLLIGAGMHNTVI